MAHILDISSSHNPQVKRLAALSHKRERSASGLFMVEGLQLVGFGVESGWSLDTLLLGQDVDMEHPVVRQAIASTPHVMRVTPPVMEKLSRKDNPQGVMGVFQQQMVSLPAFPPLAAESLWVVLEDIRDPGNLGTIIRTVDAVGASGVILLGACTDVWAPECVRATMGSLFHVPLVKASVDDFLAWKASQSGVMVGTHLRGAVDYRTVAEKTKSGPRFLVMGTEQSGLSEVLARACDLRVKIAMSGQAESLNLAIATAVMLYELKRLTLPASR